MVAPYGFGFSLADGSERVQTIDGKIGSFLRGFSNVSERRRIST
jgi:hypothetical protein